jgi:hypothetical protein
VTAALHLAHVHQPPPGPQRKRKGGGGDGDGYDRLVARVYADKRMTPEARELILLLAWLVKRDPDRFDADGNPRNSNTVWKRAVPILGDRGTRGLRGSRLADLIDADRPRYEPDMRANIWQQRLCSAPMIRRDGECGQHAVDHSLSIDPVTGWRTPLWYCARHREWGRKADVALRAMDRPEPIPNAGGLMPSYLRADRGDDGWIGIYRRASEWKHSGWKPPVKYGLRADDWPLPGMEPAPEPFRLRLAAADGELIGATS